MRRIFFFLAFFLHALLFAKDPVSFTAPDGTVYTVVKKLGGGGFATVYQVQRQLPDGKRENLALRMETVPDDPRQRITVATNAQTKLLAGIAAGQAPGLLQIDGPQTFKVEHGDDDALDPRAPNEAPPSEHAKVQLMPLTDGSLQSPAFQRRLSALDDRRATGAQLREAIRTATIVMNQTSGALGDLFGMGLVHGDIKPENFLFVARPGQEPPFEVVLADFDTVNERGATPRERVGSLAFTSPEALNTHALGPTHTSEAHDTYAWACAMYKLLFGQAPVRDYLSQPGHELSDLNVMLTISNAPDHQKMIELVRQRFADLERRMPDPFARRRAARIRQMVLAGLTFDPAERMKNVQLANYDSPLVRNQPPLTRRQKFGCLFRKLTGG